MSQTWDREAAESSFQAVLQDWESCELLEVEEWETAFERLLEEQTELVRAGEWISGRTDLLGIIGRARRELDHSAILGWLLDPQGGHGFQARFLDRFLTEALGSHCFSETDLLKASIAREVSHRDSRADIVVSLPSGNIVIELKVDAKEGEDQCDRLIKAWSRRSTNKVEFVFLAPEGYDGPKTDTSKQFRSLSFESVRGFIEELTHTTPRSPAESLGRNVALTYLQTLEREFSNG